MPNLVVIAIYQVFYLLKQIETRFLQLKKATCLVLIYKNYYSSDNVYIIFFKTNSFWYWLVLREFLGNIK